MLKDLIYLSVCAQIDVRIHVHVTTETRRRNQLTWSWSSRQSDVSWLTRVLGSKTQSSARTQQALSIPEPSSLKEPNPDF